jgi:hypothetical protein
MSPYANVLLGLINYLVNRRGLPTFALWHNRFYDTSWVGVIGVGIGASADRTGECYTGALIEERSDRGNGSPGTSSTRS